MEIYAAVLCILGALGIYTFGPEGQADNKFFTDWRHPSAKEIALVASFVTLIAGSAIAFGGYFH